MHGQPNPIGLPHYEVVERIGTRETLIGRYESRERAEGEANFRRAHYAKIRVTHGEFIVRRCEA